MNFFIEQFDDSISKSLNDELVFKEKGNEDIFPFPLDESTIPIIKEEKSLFSKNMFITKKTIKEKIKHQKLILENKKELNNISKKEMYYNKKEDLKRRNRESAQRSRDKKKLEFKQIIEENKKLKDELYIINCKINLLCSGCRSIFNIKKEDIEEDKNNNICVNCFSNNDYENDNIDINNNILYIPSTNTSFLNLRIQKVFNFILIGTLTLLCIFGIISNRSNNNIIDEKQINKLKIQQNNTNNNNISKIHDYFFGNYNDSNTNINNQEDNNNNDNFNKIEFNNNVCIKDSFSSFQCQKKSFNELYDEEHNEENYNNLKINNDNFMHNNHSKSIYFKLFVQSCSKDENYTNQNNDNDKTHLIFSSDNNKYQDFYFYCQRTEN
jgi:hypothetical protein